MKWITAADIDNWTSKESRKAQEVLPLLVWKLILASCRLINDHHFPYGDAVQYSGYDGFLDTDDTSPFFPTGKSVWEIGTNDNALDKFNSDYDKRKGNPNGIDQANTVFCFVTSRIWNHRKGIAEITEEKNQDRIWKSVRIIDANSLTLWLDNCPSVHMWLSNIMGMTITDVQDIQGFFERTIKATDPKLIPDYFTYKRDSYVKELISICNMDSTNQIVLVSDSALEAILCIAAEIVTSPDISTISFGEKCLVAHTPEALNEIETHYTNAVIFPTFAISDSPVAMHRNILVIPVGRYNPLERVSRNTHRIEIPTRTRHEFCEAIETLGYKSHEAYDLGQKLHCSFPALFRLIQTDTLKKVPEWSRIENCQRLIPALFAGAWDEKSPGDIEIVSSLADMPYKDYMASISIFTKGENTTIFSADYSYACIYVGEMWDFLLPRVLPENFEVFKDCFVKVFSYSDPTYELPEEEWYLADIRGKRSIYSNRLKESMIVSLIMLTEREKETDYVGLHSIVTKCNLLVRSVIESIDSVDKWRTICSYLPLLFEAAPSVILEKLEIEAKNEDSLIWYLFNPSSDILFGRNFYIHILWTLEKAFWDKLYASRALKLLIVFCEKQFDYQLMNKPEDTLYRVFCIWYPQGVFSFEQRKCLLTDIVMNHRLIASGLVKALLAPGGQSSSPINRPKWKAIDEIQDNITDSEIEEMYTFISSLFLSNISPCYDDWKIVFSNLSMAVDLPVIVDKCIEQVADMSEEDILKLCKELSQYISRNRKFPHSRKDRIEEVERLYNAILPNSPKCFAHYYAYHFDGLNPIPYQTDEYDFEKEQAALFIFQKEKMREMIERFGNSAVLEIIPLIEDTNKYAHAVADVLLDGKPNWTYIFQIKEYSPYIASSIIHYLYYKNGIKTLIETDDIPQGEDFGWALSCLPISEEITKIIDCIDCDSSKRAYWENVRIFGMKIDNSTWIDYCIHSLLDYNRANSVIDSLAYSDLDDPEVIIDILSAALNQYPTPDPSGLLLSQVDNYKIEKLFEKLYQGTISRSMDIARLELAYLKAFDMDFEPRCLIQQLLTSPDIYFELLTVAYHSDNEESRILTEQQKRIARTAFSALERICRIPGTTFDNNSINENEFNEWVFKTNQLAKENGFLTAHSIVLGKILSYSPVGKDGFWPAECVRSVFETAHSESLERHFINEKKNQREVYIATAGVEEEKIAEDYKRHADGLQLMYPRTAGILLCLSEEYHNDSKSERAKELKGVF